MGRNRKELAVLMRTPMSAAANRPQQLASDPPFPPTNDASSSAPDNFHGSHPPLKVTFSDVKEWMKTSIITPSDKIESVDANLADFSKGYLSLPHEGRRELLLVLAIDHDVNRTKVRELMQQYLNIEFPHGSEVTTDEQSGGGIRDEAFLASCYRMERNLRIALNPKYGDFFERLNANPGGLKILAVLRADLLSIIVSVSGRNTWYDIVLVVHLLSMTLLCLVGCWNLLHLGVGGPYPLPLGWRKLFALMSLQ